MVIKMEMIWHLMHNTAFISKKLEDKGRTSSRKSVFTSGGS